MKIGEVINCYFLCKPKKKVIVSVFDENTS